MIKTFTTQADFERWLDDTPLKSGIIAYIVNDETYVFTTNNVDGNLETYYCSYEHVMNSVFPQAIKDEIYFHHIKLHPEHQKEYVTDDALQAVSDTLNEKISENKTEIETHIEDFEHLKDKVNDLALFKFPNVTIFGEPRINNGQISNFSASNYCQFPFLVDFHNQTFEIDMCITTAEDVTTQQNILDSHFGLAFAIRGGHFVLAMSSNGTTFDMGEHVGTFNVTPSTTYYIKYKWDGSTYTVAVSDHIEGEYTTDITVNDSKSLYPTQIVIGKCNDDTFVFGGIINLNYCTLKIRDKEVWQGMDSVGIATRLQTDLGNIDSAGEAKIKEIAGQSGGSGDVYRCEFSYSSSNGVMCYYLYKNDEQIPFKALKMYRQWRGSSSSTNCYYNEYFKRAEFRYSNYHVEEPFYAELRFYDENDNIIYRTFYTDITALWS